jgi:drug/metabolite transporter (DMT)-like permease
MTASGLRGLWLMWVPLLACAWISMPSWRWSWILSLELGFVGVVWGFVGSSYLAQYPNERLLVGAVWIGFALALAGAGAMNRHRNERAGKQE